MNPKLSPFSKREKEVIDFLMQGKSNKQIAWMLGVSDSTVEFHLRNIYAKLDVASRAEAILKLSKTDLWESTGPAENDLLLGKSLVENGHEPLHNELSTSSSRRISMRALTKSKLFWLLSALAVVLVLAGVVFGRSALIQRQPPSGAAGQSILLDDFNPQPYQGEPVYPYNRLEGDRGAINNAQLEWGVGQVKLTVSPGNSWGGVWTSLNHPIREAQPVNFSAVLPSQIAPAYQSRITGITVKIEGGTRGKAFRVELKDGDQVRWKKEITLKGGPQALDVDLPLLGNINQLVWVLDRASPGDSVVLDQVSFRYTTAIQDTATKAFVWSYGMLLDNWNPATGLVRDKAKDASGEFDAIQSTGSLAAATAMAEQLGVISHANAVQVVSKIAQTLGGLPRQHGLLPHWVKGSPEEGFTIVENTEWSSVDTTIALVGLLEAQSALGLPVSSTEQMLQGIDWGDLTTPKGISHGYSYAGERISYAWDTFGGEAWLVELAYAGANGQVTSLAYPSPPTANGSGFIDELAWLFVAPPSGKDAWGTDWAAYRQSAASNQIAYFPTSLPKSCQAQLGLFGLSAAEAPEPARVSQQDIYQAFGVGGQFSPAKDGSKVFAGPVAVPHYSALEASLNAKEALQMWDWLIQQGLFTPMNNVESLMFSGSGCDATSVTWNQLKGSWNLALQALGWGRYLAQRDGQAPILWQAEEKSTFLQKGYQVLATAASSSAASTPATWILSIQGEDASDGNVGRVVSRSAASGKKVYGQFGAEASSPWQARPGYVGYNFQNVPSIDQLYLKLRYSKNSPTSVPILIYIDNERSPRATFYPVDQGDWNVFVWSEPIWLGSLGSGAHTLRFATEGQQYGVAELDLITLLVPPGLVIPPTAIPPAPTEPPLQGVVSPQQDYTRECETPDETTVGQMIVRTNASGAMVLGQFGAANQPSWPVKAGYARYGNIVLPADAKLDLKLRYSKYSSASVPILIYLDDEPVSRAQIFPVDQGDWNRFAWTDLIPLGEVANGVHSIRFETAGQQYGVADLDVFILSVELPGPVPAPTTAPASTQVPAPIPASAPTEAPPPTPFYAPTKAPSPTQPVLPPPVLGEAKIFFSFGENLYQMNLDGSHPELLAVGVDPSSEHGFTFDPIHLKLYMTSWDAPGQIKFYDFRSGGGLNILSDGPGSGGQGLAVDPGTSTLYLGLYYDGVYGMDLNRLGSWRHLVYSSSLAPMLGQRGQLQIDPNNRQVYFRSAFNGECGECRYIWRADFDGGNLVKIIRANGGDALGLDLFAGKLYFSDYPGDNTVKRADLDGSAPETILTVPAPYNFIRTISVDPFHQKIYLSVYDIENGSAGRAIARVNTDGTQFEILYSATGATESEVHGGMTLYLP